MEERLEENIKFPKSDEDALKESDNESEYEFILEHLNIMVFFRTKEETLCLVLENVGMDLKIEFCRSKQFTGSGICHRGQNC